MSTKKLGFGLMRLPSLDPNDPAKIDLEQTKNMVDAFLERGFTYFDTAWMYCGFQSEPTVKEALVSRYPRESFTLAAFSDRQAHKPKAQLFAGHSQGNILHKLSSCLIPERRRTFSEFQ